MLRIVLRRLLMAVPILLAATIIVFFLVHLVPGDPAIQMAGEFATTERIQEIQEEFGFDQPVFVQYGNWLLDAMQGDLGTSLSSKEPVVSALLARISPTALLVSYGLVIALLVGTLAGTYQGSRSGTKVDSLLTSVTMLGVAVPNFWLGMVLIATLALGLGWFPALGYPSSPDGMWNLVWYLTLPAITLSTLGVAEIARQVRAGVSETMQSDFVRTHRAKGISEGEIISKYALKNAGIPVLTILGLLAPRMLGATVVVETLFGIPGIGRLVAQSAIRSDYPVVQGVVLVMGIVVIVVNVVVDVSYRLLDPRVRS